jgi:hypothetical protein
MLRAIANWVSFWICRAGILALGGYLLPAIIGTRRDTATVALLFVINLFYGWTVIGWLACLLWAVYGRTTAEDAHWQRIAQHEPLAGERSRPAPGRVHLASRAACRYVWRRPSNQYGG